MRLLGTLSYTVGKGKAVSAMKTWGKWRYSSTILDLKHQMEVCGQLNNLVALPPGISTPVPNE
jgi:hypothetical protein